MAFVKNGATIKLEFSEDDLSVSNTSATWQDVSDYLIETDWGYGTQNELDFADAGEATLVLGKANSRDFEPGYTAGRFYPNVLPLRRFRLSINGTKQGVWYAKSYTPSWPDTLNYEAVTVQCVDGFGILSLDELEAMDPPDAQSYEDVVQFDEPVHYYSLGEPIGTKLVSHLRSKKWRRKHPRRAKKYKTVETRAEMGGVSGPAGVYKNTPTLGGSGAIVGSADTSVLFTAASSEYARVPLDDSDLIDTNRLSVEAWVHPMTDATQTVVAGPNASAISRSVFRLYLTATGQAGFRIEATDGTFWAVESSASAVPTGLWTYLVGTWDGSTIRLYINGAAPYAIGLPPSTLRQGDAGGYLYIGRDAVGAYFNGVIDEVAVYEKALSAERVLAHATAGADRGFPQQVAADRVVDLVTSPLWDESALMTFGLQVIPRFKFGQSKVEELDNTASAEMPDGLFYFDGDGDPVYLPWDYRSEAPYPTTQATLGTGPGEVNYTSITPRYDDEIFNEITVSTEDSGTHMAEDLASQTAYGIRRHKETGLPLANEPDADTIAARLLDIYSQPRWRVEDVTVTANSAYPNRLAAILNLEIGELVRIKHRVLGGAAIDIVTHILGVRKSLSRDGVLSATWNLARGWDATAGGWHLGITGFSELGTTTKLG